MLITSRHDYMEVLLDVTPDDGKNPEFTTKAEHKKVEFPVAKGGKLTITTTCEDYPEFVVLVENADGGHTKHEGSKTKPVTLAMRHDAKAGHKLTVTYNPTNNGTNNGKNGGKDGGKNPTPPIQLTAMAYPCGPCPR
jgi:hypothetical protein